MRIFRNKYGEVRSGYKIISVLLTTSICQSLVGVFLYIFIGRSMLINSMGDGIGVIRTLVIELILIFTPILFWIALEKKGVNKMGLINIKKAYKEFIVGLVFGAITISVSAIVLIGFNEVQIRYTAKGVGTIKLLIGSLITYISVGFAEEILCRGYIMSILKRTRNKYAVIIISSLIFAAMHLGNYGITPLAFLNLALVGALFAYMFMKSKNIWMCIGYHITWNYFQGAIWGFSVSGTEENGICSLTSLSDNLINGGAFGPEGGLVVTVITCLAFIFVYRYYINKDANEFMDMV